jgi:hypothetical protein
MFGAFKNSCIKEFSKIENRVLSSKQLGFGFSLQTYLFAQFPAHRLAPFTRRCCFLTRECSCWWPLDRRDYLALWEVADLLVFGEFGQLGLVDVRNMKLAFAPVEDFWSWGGWGLEDDEE